MKRLASLKNISEEEWHKLRQKGIGGSDVGTLMGYNKYKTNIQLWEEKIGAKLPKCVDTPATLRGKKSEENILKLWEAFNLSRVKIIKPEYQYCHSEYEWIRANFDSFGIVDGEKCIIEIKTAEVKNMSEWFQKVPMTYYLQCLHYMLVSGLKTVWLIAGIRILGKDDIIIKSYKIERNEEDIEMIFKAEFEFYQHMITKTKPKLKKVLEI